MSTPRIRSDLQATPTEEGGIKYFDVSDPKSGARMRMYDFEWLIAERMDGRRPFDEVASWARERLGIAPTASDLEEYARKLRELGFFELGEGEDLVRSAPNAPTMMREAPTLPSGGNGAGKAAAAQGEDEDDMPDMVAESTPIGAVRSNAPAATAPTMAMPITTERPAVAAPVPERPAAPKTPAPATHSSTGRTAAVQNEPPSRSRSRAMSSVASTSCLTSALAICRSIAARRRSRPASYSAFVSRRRCGRICSASCMCTTSRPPDSIPRTPRRCFARSIG